jgi:hypothetical protein
MRARWLALGLLLGLATLAVAQPGGPGFFMSPSCLTLANPVAGSTVCWQSGAPNSWFYWNGTAFVAPPLSGPFAPTSFAAGAVLIGGGAGPITTTTNLTLTSLVITGPAPGNIGITLLTPYMGMEPAGTAAGDTGMFYFRELAANGTDFVGIKAPDALAATYTLVLPTTKGTSGQCLGSDGGTPVQTAWVPCSAGVGTGITTLNGLTLVTQTFANDTNVQITSATSTHTLTWAGTLAVSRGGLGVGTLTGNGVLVGNNTGPVQVTAAGGVDTVLRVPGGGGGPSFGAVDVSKAAAITGLMRTANLGSGAASSATFLRGDQTWASPAAGVGTYNYVFNSDMEVWGAGPSAAPTGWTLAGGGVARTTTVGQFKTGTAAAALTSGGTTVLTQRIDLIYPPITAWQSQVVTCGAWVHATLPGSTAIRIDDGVGATDSAPHSGGGAFEFLTVSRSLSNVATQFQFFLAATATTSQVDGLICVRGASVVNWQPSGWLGRKAIVQYSTGGTATLASGTQFFSAGWISSTETETELLMPFRCVLRNVSARGNIAPGGAQTVTLRLRINEADALIGDLVLAGASQQATNYTQEAEIGNGGRTTMRAIKSGVATTTFVVVTSLCEEVPEGI